MIPSLRFLEEPKWNLPEILHLNSKLREPDCPEATSHCRHPRASWCHLFAGFDSSEEGVQLMLEAFTCFQQDPDVQAGSGEELGEASLCLDSPLPKL